MNRVILFSLLLVILSFGCKKETSTQVNDEIPQWLQTKIDSMSVNKSYGGTVVYRYKWHNEYIYYIDIPISSCMYCEIYNQNGDKIQFTSDSQIQDFINNKTDEVIIWGHKF